MREFSRLLRHSCFGLLQRDMVDIIDYILSAIEGFLSEVTKTKPVGSSSVTEKKQKAHIANAVDVSGSSASYGVIGVHMSLDQ